MLSVYEQIKVLEKKLNELEKEYQEKENELSTKEEKFASHGLFADFRGASDYQHGFSIEGFLSLERDGRYLKDPEFAYTFYQRYAHACEYANELNSLDESIENINILGQKLFEYDNALSESRGKIIPEDKKALRPFKAYEYPFSLYTGTPGVYAVAIAALKLARVKEEFQELYTLKCECDNRKEHIMEIKKQVNDYKFEVARAIATGAAAKTEQVVNTVVKPAVDCGIKFLIKKFTQPNDENQE